MLHVDLTRRIIGCAHAVYNSVGPGFLEAVYQRGLLVELVANEHRASWEVPIPLWHRNVDIGEFRADIVVDDLVLLELKAVDRLLDCHFAQILNYLRVSGIEVGLLLNFGPTGVEVKRAIMTDHQRAWKPRGNQAS